MIASDLRYARVQPDVRYTTVLVTCTGNAFVTTATHIVHTARRGQALFQCSRQSVGGTHQAGRAAGRVAAARRGLSNTWTACVGVVCERVGVLPVGAGSVGGVMQQAIEPTMQSISTCCRQGGLADRGGYTTPGAANSPPARESCGVCTQGATTRHVRQSQEAAAWHKAGVVGPANCVHTAADRRHLSRQGDTKLPADRLGRRAAMLCNSSSSTALEGAASMVMQSAWLPAVRW